MPTGANFTTSDWFTEFTEVCICLTHRQNNRRLEQWRTIGPKELAFSWPWKNIQNAGPGNAPKISFYKQVGEAALISLSYISLRWWCRIQALNDCCLMSVLSQIKIAWKNDVPHAGNWDSPVQFKLRAKRNEVMPNTILLWRMRLCSKATPDINIGWRLWHLYHLSTHPIVIDEKLRHPTRAWHLHFLEAANVEWPRRCVYAYELKWLDMPKITAYLGRFNPFEKSYNSQIASFPQVQKGMKHTKKNMVKRPNLVLSFCGAVSCQHRRGEKQWISVDFSEI